MKLHPPYIEGTLPAFYKDSTGVVKLTIPFSMNRTVSPNDILGFTAKIKTAQNNVYIFTLRQTDISWYTIGTNSEVTFILEPSMIELGGKGSNNLSVGQYYKVQIAYIANDANNTVGYYSTVGIIKYTTEPTVYIQSLVASSTNAHNYAYTGVYRQYKLGDDGINESDVTEKVYSYQFILTDKNGNIIDDTGVQIHNVDTNVESYESIDDYKYDSDLLYDQTYFIQYIIYTNNKMTIKSPKYKILQKRLIPPNLNAQLKAELNFDNGYIDIKLVGNTENDIATGAFIISRACSTDNFKTWSEVFRFSLHGDSTTHDLFRDFTVEQGKEYVYGLQQYNDYGLYSSRLLSNIIMADFEDIFLFDGYRQLKIRFNPKVSSFKTTLLETKIDTIGSKYPFIFRNGKVAYKEFPISGLISYLSDEAQLFMKDNELGLDDSLSHKSRERTVNKSVYEYTEEDLERLERKNMAVSARDIRRMQTWRTEDEKIFNTAKIRTTQPEGYNVAAERMFKLAVLDWLNDGEIKLFRSPGEGNYLVRLMNVSLTPEDRVGRMLHTFQCTAYEMADCSYYNLLKYNIVNVKKNIFATPQYETVPLRANTKIDKRYAYIGPGWYQVRGEILTKWAPAIALKIEGVEPGSKFILGFKNGGTQEIIVGATGNYELDIQEEISSIKVPNDAKYQGQLTYRYYTETTNTFNEVTNFKLYERLGQQYIGSYKNVVKDIGDEKFALLKFYYLHFYKRDIIYTDELPGANDNPLYLYCVTQENATVRSITTGINYNIKGIVPVESSIVKAHLISNINQEEYVVPECYYYFKNQQLTQSKGSNQGPFNKDIQYYELEPFKLYYDVQGNVIVSQYDYDRIISFLTIMTRQQHTISNINILSTEIEIDGSKMELEDTGRFYIDDVVNFNSIKISNGVYLECGYELQEIIYSVEEELKDEHESYFLYNYYLSGDYYSDMMNGVNGILESVYNENVAIARDAYPELYQEYLQQLILRIQ